MYRHSVDSAPVPDRHIRPPFEEMTEKHSKVQREHTGRCRSRRMERAGEAGESKRERERRKREEKKTV